MSRTRSWRVAAAAALIASAAAFAQADAAGMTLEDAVRYALEHTPTVVKQQAVVATAEETYIKQRSSSLPNVEGSLQNFSSKSSNLQGNFAIAGISQQEQFSQNTAQIGTNYTLNTGGLAFLQTYSTNYQLKSSQADLRRIEDQVANDVTTSYYTIASRDETVRLDASNVDYQHTLVQISKAKERAGVAAGVDVLSAQATEARSRSTLVGDQAQAADARESLALLIGAPLDTAFYVPSEVPEPALPAGSVEQLVATAETNRPDVASAQLSLRAAQYTRKGWDRELFPQVQLTAAFGNQFSPTTVPPPGSTLSKAGFWQLQAISTFTLPLEDYGARRSERLADDAQVESAQNALDQADEQAALDVRQAYRGAQAAKEQVQFAEEAVRSGVESARVARLQYANGINTITDVLQAQTTSLTSQIDLFDARVNYVEAVVKLRTALGVYSAPSAVADLTDTGNR